MRTKPPDLCCEPVLDEATRDADEANKLKAKTYVGIKRRAQESSVCLLFLLIQVIKHAV